MSTIARHICAVMAVLAICRSLKAEGSYFLRLDDAELTAHLDNLKEHNGITTVDAKIHVRGENASCIVVDPFIGALGRQYAAIRLVVTGEEQPRIIPIPAIGDATLVNDRISPMLGAIVVRDGQVVGRRVELVSQGGTGVRVACTLQLVLYDGIAEKYSSERPQARVFRSTSDDIVAASAPISWMVDPTARVHCVGVRKGGVGGTDAVIEYNEEGTTSEGISCQIYFVNNNDHPDEIFDPMFRFRHLVSDEPRRIRIFQFNEQLGRFDSVTRGDVRGKALPIDIHMYWQIPPEEFLVKQSWLENLGGGGVMQSRLSCTKAAGERIFGRKVEQVLQILMGVENGEKNSVLSSRLNSSLRSCCA
ncbi:MAG: hypothetical protein R3C18_07690 [Planctomycetaceae bacterium]